VKFSVYIATSVDGFNAREDGSVDWLELYGNHEAEMGENADMGFGKFINSVDCLIMGRSCMEKISSMNLTPEQ
jgi:dihydrofolate reductase